MNATVGNLVTEMTPEYLAQVFDPLSMPLYFTPRANLTSWISDKYLTVFLPLAVYWVVSTFWLVVDTMQPPFFEKYRLHEPEEIKKRNKVDLPEVLQKVIIQQVLQAAVAYYIVSGEEATAYGDGAELRHIAVLASRLAEAGQRLLGLDPHFVVSPIGKTMVELMYWWAFPGVRLIAGLLFLDTWQYFWHRAMHVNRFLYRHVHALHHRLYVPYAFGALYNHPVEGFIMDTLGAGLAFTITGMTTREGLFFFTFSTIKTVDDHCGYALPFDPLQIFFPNNASYHDIHHQSYGIKKNFSQPYLVVWDKYLGTMMRPEDVPARFRKQRPGKAQPTIYVPSELDGKAVRVDGDYPGQPVDEANSTSKEPKLFGHSQPLQTEPGMTVAARENGTDPYDEAYREHRSEYNLRKRV